MSDKALKRVMIILAIVIISVFVIFFIATRPKQGGIKDAEYEDKQKKEQIQKIQTGEVTGKYESKSYNYEYLQLDNEGREKVDESVDFVLDLINNHKVDEIWNLLSPKYREYKFTTKEHLEKFLNKYYPKDKRYTATNYELYNDDLSVNIEEEGNISEGNVQVVKLMYYLEDDKTLFFGNFNYFDEIEILAETDEVVLHSYAIFHYNDAASLVFKAENKLNEDINLSVYDSIAYIPNARVYSEMPQKDNAEVLVRANDEEMFEVAFEPFSSSLQKLQFNLKINDKEYKSKMIYLSHVGTNEP